MCDSESLGWPYSVLGLVRIPDDKKTIKQAYAKQLKQIDQIEEPDKFQELRSAYESCLVNFEYDTIVKPLLGDEVFEDHLPLTARPQSLVTNQAPASVPQPVSKVPETAPSQTIAIGEQKTDWVLVNALCNEVWVEGDEITEIRIKRILNNRIFDDPDAMQSLERTIYDYLVSKILYDSKGMPSFDGEQISATLLTSLDTKFSWLSDYISLKQRFGNIDDFIVASSDLIGTHNSSEHIKFWSSFSSWAAPIARHPITILTSFAFAIVSPSIFGERFPDAPNFLIGACGYIVFWAVLVAWLGAGYVYDIDKISDFLFSGSVWALWLLTVVGLFLLKIYVVEVPDNLFSAVIFLYPFAAGGALLVGLLVVTIRLFDFVSALTRVQLRKAFGWITRNLS